MIIEQDVQITLADGVTDAVLLRQDGNMPWPGILYFTDIGGVRPAQRQAAYFLAAEGYVVLMPNLFYRVAKPPVMNMELRATPDLFRQRIIELAQPLTPEALERDAHGYVEFLAREGSLRDKNKLGVAGFCIGGGLAMRVAAAFPDQIAACASFHGGGLYESKPTSPHLLLPAIKARLLFGHAVGDASMPAEAIHAFEGALERWGGEYESETYEGAQHGWTTRDSPIYNPEQAARAYAKMTAMFAETLRPAA